MVTVEEAEWRLEGRRASGSGTADAHAHKRTAGQEAGRGKPTKQLENGELKGNGKILPYQ